MKTRNRNTCLEPRCTDCNKIIQITVKELVQIVANNSSKPKQCRACLQARRKLNDPYDGIYECFYSYPPTKGHRYQVHGQYLTEY